MPLRKAEKIRVAKKYADVLQAAPNAVVVQYDGIAAEEMNALKAQVKADGGEIFVVRKRLLLKSLEAAGATAIERDQLPGSILLVAAPADAEDEFATLKIVNKVAKTLKKKDKEEKKKLNFLGGRFSQERQDSDYVVELANLPTQGELVSKFLFLAKYPAQSFASVLSQLAEKMSDGQTVADLASGTPAATPENSSEKTEETPVENSEEKSEENSDAAPAEEKSPPESTDESPADAPENSEEKTE